MRESRFSPKASWKICRAFRERREKPQLEAFEQRYEAAMQRIPQAAALPDPMLQVTSRGVRPDPPGPQENVFMLSQKLPWFGKLGSRKEVASSEAEALWYAYQNQQPSLVREVSLAYYEYGYAEAIR